MVSICTYLISWIHFLQWLCHSFLSPVLECSGKITELGLEDLSFGSDSIHHIMAVMILAKYELLKGRGLVLFISVFPTLHTCSISSTVCWIEHITEFSHLFKREKKKRIWSLALILAHTIKHYFRFFCLVIIYGRTNCQDI